MGQYSDLTDAAQASPSSVTALGARLASETPPDRAAQALQMARRYGLPAGVAETFVDDYKARATMEDNRALLERAPRLQSWVDRNPMRAAAAQDDMPSLAEVERRIAQFGELKAPDPIKPSFSTVASGLFESFTQGFRMMREGARMQAGDMLGLPIEDAQRRYEQARARADAATPEFESTTARGLYGGGESLARVLPSTVAAIALRNPALGLVSAGAQTQTEAYGKYRTRGATAGEAALGSFGEGAVEVATEKIPMGFLVERFGKTGAKEFLSGMLLREMPTEQVATLLQDAIDTAIANPDKTWGEYFAERPEAAYQTALGVLVQSSFFGAANTVARRLSKDDDRAKQAEQTAAAAQELSKLAEASKLRGRDAESFREFVQQVADEEGDAPTEFYIDGAVLANTLNQSGVTMQELEAIAPVVASQLEAAMTGGDVRVPVSEFLTAGEALTAPLVDHLRMTPDGMSRAEAQDYMKEQGDRIQREVEEELQRVDDQAQFRQSIESVRSEFEAELGKAKRFTADVNRAYADLLANFYGATAARLGMTPQELLAKYRLRVQSKLADGQRVMEQGAPDTPEFRNWFGDSKVVDAQGRPLVVYHGTNRGGFTQFKMHANSRSDGFVFTDSRDLAATYAANDTDLPSSGVKSGIYPAYLSVKNLKEVDWGGSYFQRDDGTKTDDVIAQAKAEGFDGIVIRNVNDPGGNASMRANRGKPGFDAAGDLYVVFSPEQIKSTENRGTFDPNDPSILNQGETPRAQISLPQSFDAGPAVISLLENADLSSFLHESGHLFLEIQADLAIKIQQQISAGASVTAGERQIVWDMNRLLEWFGVKGDENLPPLQAWAMMSLDEKRAYHEQFARGFEAYAFEGKAPSLELQSIFQRFRSWLLQVYQTLRNLNVELNDDVRAVMGRMLASDFAIEEAEAARNMGPLFKDAESAGMTLDEFNAYQGLARGATEDAIAQLQARGLKDMRWLSRARDKALKARQQEVDELRREVRNEIRSEVYAEPVYRAWQYLTSKSEDAAEAGKLRTEELRDAYGVGEDAIWRKLSARRMTSDTIGRSPDSVAEDFGFDSGDALVKALADATPPAETIEARTDQRMLEMFGDITSPQALQRASDEAVHNEARARVIAAELKALQAANRVREGNERTGLYRGGTVNILAKAAKEYAQQIVNRLPVRNIRPAQYAAAEARSARLAEKALAAGKLDEAAMHKRNQLVNNHAAKAAYEAQANVKKALDFFGKVNTGNAEKIAETRDVALVNVARAVLAEYGIGTKGKTALEYLDAVESNEPELAAVLRDRVGSMTAGAMPYKDMPVERVLGLADEVRALWAMAERTRQIEIDGKLIDRARAQMDIAQRLEELGVPERIPGEGRAVTDAERRTGMLRSAWAALRRVESWSDLKDAGSAARPFRRYVWQPIRDAADRYRADKAKYLKAYRDLLKTVDLGRSRIDAPELGYTFGYSRGGSGKQEILHALLHTGNDSNKRKLLVGRGWGQVTETGELDSNRWDTFIRRMVDQGVLTKADFDFVQGVWDLLEQIKPLAQKAHRDVFGRYFDEVTAQSFDTPFGAYRGGYVPALADPEVVSDAKTRALVEAENQTLALAFPQTARGFTKARVEYNKPLLLDLRSLGQHIDKVLMFAHLEQPVRDVRKVLASKEVSQPMSRADPAALDGLLTPWLNRVARQQVETPVPGSNGLMRFFTKARSRAGMAAMFANVVNTAQQITGLSIAAVKVKPRHLLHAAAQMVHSPRKTAQAVAEASPYMATRMDNEIAQATDAINDILLNPSVYERAQAWSAKHAYFMQSAVDNFIGPIVWQGAYNQALEAGETEADAVRLADSAVRQTQGSTLPEDIARFESGNAFVRMFTQFASYFNMQANLLGSEFAVLARDLGLRRGAGRGLYVFLFGFLAPALVSELIVQAARGGPGDDDDDGEYLDDWLAALTFGTLRSGVAMVPVAGQIATTAANMANSKPYDDRMSTSPAISMIESAVRAPTSVYEAIAEDKSAKKAIRDVATLITMTTGLPATAVARPLGYAADVAQDRVDPTGPIDAARGAVTGVASPASKE